MTPERQVAEALDRVEKLADDYFKAIQHAAPGDALNTLMDIHRECKQVTFSLQRALRALP